MRQFLKYNSSTERVSRSNSARKTNLLEHLADHNRRNDDERKAGSQASNAGGAQHILEVQDVGQKHNAFRIADDVKVRFSGAIKCTDCWYLFY
jgi:hypothetical protein